MISAALINKWRKNWQDMSIRELYNMMFIYTQPPENQSILERNTDITIIFLIQQVIAEKEKL